MTSWIPSSVTTPEAIVVKSADAHGQRLIHIVMIPRAPRVLQSNARSVSVQLHRQWIVGIEPRVSIRAFVPVSKAAPDFLL